MRISDWSSDVCSSDLLGYSAAHRLYETSDGWICVAATRGPQRAALLETYGIASDAAVDDAALARTLADKFKVQSAKTAFAALDQAGVPVEIVDPEFSRKLHDNAEFQNAQWVVSYPYPPVGKLAQIG